MHVQELTSGKAAIDLQNQSAFTSGPSAYHHQRKDWRF
jgi:hypothetical protein